MTHQKQALYSKPLCSRYSSIVPIAILITMVGMTAIGWSRPATADNTPAPIVVKPIENGRYWIGHTDQGLEVQGKRYRYDTEEGTQPWKDIADLTYVRNGVVFDGRNHWCLSTLFPKGKIASCTAEGWKIHVPRTKPLSAPRQSVLSPQDLEALLSKGMTYADFRKTVLSNGWTPLVSPDCKTNVGGKALICDRLPEVNACSGDGYCLMFFEDKMSRTRLSVTTYGPATQVKHWGFKTDP
jgi:hypothetical protein